jgi:penicillin-binding protein 1A
LNHPLGGKTGTTSDYTDAWFLGFSPSVTCGVWVGFDSRQSLGEKETGARAALPIWMAWMREAIAGKDDEKFLADQSDSTNLKAAAESPAKPGTSPVASPIAGSIAKQGASSIAGPTGKPVAKTTVKPGIVGAAAKPPLTLPQGGASTKPVKAAEHAKLPLPPGTPASTANARTQSAGKPSLLPANGAKPLVKPALPPPAAPAKPKTTVKPALPGATGQ